jgi:hypothetical protein
MPTTRMGMGSAYTATSGMTDTSGSLGTAGQMMVSTGPGMAWTNQSSLTWIVGQVTGAAPLASPSFSGTVTLPATVNGPASLLTITDSNGVLISGSAVNRGVNVNTVLATDGVALQDNTAANSLIVSATAGGILLETSGGGHVAVSGGDFSIAVNHIVGNTDIAGTVTITGATSQAVTFTTAYGSTPKAVSLTPLGDTTTVGPYWVTALSATGFTANIHTSGTMSFYYQVIG